LGAARTVDKGSGAHDAHAVFLEHESDDLQFTCRAREGVLESVGAVLQRPAHEEFGTAYFLGLEGVAGIEVHTAAAGDLLRDGVGRDTNEAGALTRGRADVAHA